jgi:hypothetical protein
MDGGRIRSLAAFNPTIRNPGTQPTAASSLAFCDMKPSASPKNSPNPWNLGILSHITVNKISIGHGDHYADERPLSREECGRHEAYDDIQTQTPANQRRRHDLSFEGCETGKVGNTPIANQGSMNLTSAIITPIGQGHGTPPTTCQCRCNPRGRC